jgi:hypothetical protein
MRLPVAYRSLARPSSVLEPSHSPDGIATPKDKQVVPIFRYDLTIESAYQCCNQTFACPIAGITFQFSVQRQSCTRRLSPPMATGGVSPSPPTLLGGCTGILIDEYYAYAPYHGAAARLAPVDLLGFEPRASALQRRRSSN